MQYPYLCALSLQIMNKRQRIISSHKNTKLEAPRSISKHKNSRNLIKSDNRSTSIINHSLSTTNVKVKPFILQYDKLMAPYSHKKEIEKDINQLYEINRNLDKMVSNLCSNIQYKQLEKYDMAAQNPRDRLAKVQRQVLIESIQRILPENRNLFMKLVEKHTQRVNCTKIHQFIISMKSGKQQLNLITKQQWIQLQNDLFSQFLKQKQELDKLKASILHYKKLQENLKVNSQSLQNLDHSKYGKMHDLQKKLRKTKNKKQKLQNQNREKLAQLQYLQKQIIRAQRLSAQLENQQIDIQTDINYKKSKLTKANQSLTLRQANTTKSVSKKN